jgi:hypothetical protein
MRCFEGLYMVIYLGSWTRELSRAVESIKRWIWKDGKTPVAGPLIPRYLIERLEWDPKERVMNGSTYYN